MTVDTYNTALALQDNIDKMTEFLSNIDAETPETVTVSDIKTVTVLLDELTLTTDENVIDTVNAANAAYYTKLRTDLTTKKAELQTQFDNL